MLRFPSSSCFTVDSTWIYVLHGISLKVRFCRQEVCANKYHADAHHFLYCTHDPVEATQVDVHNAMQTLCPLCRASFLIDSREGRCGGGDCVRWDCFMKFMITILLCCANELTTGWIYKRITAKIIIIVCRAIELQYPFTI